MNFSAPTLDLFTGAPVPDWLAHPGSPLERRFRDFHEAHPDVYRELEARCFALLRAGRTRIGLKAVYEALRFDRLVRTDGPEPWKLNNSYTALYARLLLSEHPKLAGVIETRQRRRGAAA